MRSFIEKVTSTRNRVPGKKARKKADVCLFLEGTYPYVSGGVSSWTHELIQMQSHLTFSIVSMIGAGASTVPHYVLPGNVVNLTTISMQKLPKKGVKLTAKEARSFFRTIRKPLLNLQYQRADLNDLNRIIQAFSSCPEALSSTMLFDSREAWHLLLYMYNTTMPESAFLDYFWSWRSLLGGLYSVLVAELPEADIYHALCTGYAGLFLARARIETGKPCIVTEHGIYTNERRIEIASADWLENQRSFNLAVNKTENDRELKDFWIDSFSGYSRLCYSAANHIVTLYEGNQTFQRMDGAYPGKLKVIQNGIDFERFSKIERDNNHPPTIALIGRVVPIKDIKTFIRAASILKESIPDLQALILGPTDEDTVYFNECLAIMEHMKLEDTVRFLGKVMIDDYLGRIDIVVLSSISEAQPLVILEAGAAGVPTVATDVGACREMILGRADEDPPLGPGGTITKLYNPQAIAESLRTLFSDPLFYAECSKAIKERVQRYYHKKDQYAAYYALYNDMK